MTDEQIDAVIAKRNDITSLRTFWHRLDELDRLDARLRTVPPGQRNDVDRLLGRACAVLSPRVDYNLAENNAEWMQQQEERYQRATDDWRNIRGDLDI